MGKITLIEIGPSEHPEDLVSSVSFAICKSCKKGFDIHSFLAYYEDDSGFISDICATCIQTEILLPGTIDSNLLKVKDTIKIAG